MGMLTCLISVACTLALSTTLAYAGAAGEKSHPPKPGRLGMPQSVTCTKSGDQLTLAWSAVEHAQQYRVYLEAEDGGELVDTVPASTLSYTHPLSDMSDDPATEVKGHLRAMASKMGKDASKPTKPVTCQ